MKRIWNHPEEPQTGKRYWRSSAELERRSEFLNKLGVEFPAGDTLNDEERETSRRDFLKLMGASTAMMGLASCRRPLTNILPYTDHVEWMVPGKPLLYATVKPTATGATPIVAITHEGRPTHLQGNPLHPLGGGLDSYAQASVLDLYDPERSSTPLAAGKKTTWDAVNSFLTQSAEAAKKAGGADLAILVGRTTSPTTHRLLGEVKTAFPQASLIGYEALSTEGQDVANKDILGAGVKTFVRLSQALRILSLDCDFLGIDPVAGESIKHFAKQRSKDTPGGDMNRLYQLENRYTVTGGMADHRKPLAASLIPVAAAVIAAELGEASAKALADTAPQGLKEWLAPAIRDLQDNKGKSLVLAGSRYGAEVHALVAAINNALGAYGSTIALLQSTGETELGTLADLKSGLESGKIKTIVSLSPSSLLFDAPGAADLAATLKDKAIQLIHVGHLADVTARKAALHIPAAHYLESWGDARAADGTYSVVQPLILPLYDGSSENEVLLALLGRKKLGPVAPAADPAAPAPEDAAYQAVRDTFTAVAGSLDEVKWNATLRDGFLKGSAYVKSAGVINTAAVAGLVSKAAVPAAPSADSLEVVLTPDSGVYDGRYISNAWLQEAPDPVTKLTWDNAALIGAATFRSLGLKEGQMVKITVNGAELTIAAIEAPGHVSNSISIPVGYGQENLGFVASGNAEKAKKSHRGFNAYPLRKSLSDFVLTGAKIEKLDEVYELAITQEHNTMEGRALYREATLETFAKKPDFAQVTGMDGHIPQNISFYKGQVGEKSATNPEGFDYEKQHQWGMTIDLSKCLGCNACNIACTSENNIPVVGKDQVRKGRLMQWIRMDRYFASATWGEQNAPSDDVMIEPTVEQLENAEMVQQPVACQQCESAPCETVCPVNATVHTTDGLNAMAYNRCIGTRYCANNCPYTARRFNWFDYNKRPLDELYWGPLSTKEKTGVRESLQLQKNPNVTVRMRGVIEKCTYCVQRLESAKILQKQKQRDSKNFRIPTDSVKTACQAACSTDAIVFGDLADPKSAVVKSKASPRNYELLKYIGTRPRTSYLARLRNPNPAMPGAENIAAWSAHQI
ncbi:prokaryotic molybdopterin-containing oxidoreductase family, iron-sulfur binding subunit [Prosthecobacter debontii]|uniref:Prokaryotic molybdopterin-containing oxidoreductase family, iron-sulfur binding subunit n=1 Tax=Prosthecobacter debontii TaxID=48467 RepID=A0A1T4YDL4_9BACT|nr:TAT-variant-translocated molybdopterin oxidoreductase [Prosthecobacter debontii]SKA99411.1 prokaryotic molybdopterin-containing oxidoreductase family, iron-sulfur binding subunit [Prosthecobacter debontii]